MSDVRGQIRQVIDAYGGLVVPLADLTDQDDLYHAGLTSHASVNVMLGLEEAFDLEFPDAMLRKGTFQSVQSIQEALRQLGVSD